MYDRQALIELVRCHALRFGQFTLASGKRATFYLDCKQITLEAAGAQSIGHGMLELLGPSWPDAVGGMSIGADPIVGAMLAMAGQRGQSLRGFLVRKEPKGHGTGQFIEGPVEPGQEAVIVEDVITTAGSAILAYERATQFGLKVRRVVAIIDRLEGGEAALAQRDLSLVSLLTIRDLGIEPGG